MATLRGRRAAEGAKALTTVLADHLPRALVQHLAQDWGLSGNLGDQSDRALRALSARLADWPLTPTSSEGYRTAEVTLGGVATDDVSSKTMESRLQPGLFLIGEVMDVTGWLGGYNFQWAWSSGHAAGSAIKRTPGHRGGPGVRGPKRVSGGRLTRDRVQDTRGAGDGSKLRDQEGITDHRATAPRTGRPDHLYWGWPGQGQRQEAGSSTESITWIMPFDWRTSAIVILARRPAPSSIWITPLLK